MTWQGIVQFLVLAVALAITVPPLGRYMAAVYGDHPDDGRFGRACSAAERRIYRVMGVDPGRQQRWSGYALSLLAFTGVSLAGLYTLLRLQGTLPFNPTDRPAVGAWGAFNTAVSFVTNTNWQWYSGEVTMSHLSQMLGLTVQNFVSAAAGMAIVVAMIRGFTRTGTRMLGNFWVDLVRTVVRILLPLALVTALALVSQGVVQNLRGSQDVRPVDTTAMEVQHLPGGPVASQVAIKQLGSNGGGFFNANSAHPFENPNGWTNLIELYMILLIPLAFTVTFGVMVGDRRQGRVLLGVMALLVASFSAFAVLAEQEGNPALTTRGVDQSLSTGQVGGNLEGKEVRLGAASCGLWAGATTGTSNGSVNCMHDSFTPLGGMAPMLHMMLGEVSPGGVGVGLMGMLVYAMLAVFIAGLMVGRTPEYLGKKIQAAEMKLVVLFIVAVPLVLLGFAAPSVLLDSTQTFQGGAHGLSEVLYNYASASNNNGSAFAYMGTGTRWYTVTQGLAMLVGRLFLIIPALAIAGSLGAKPKVPANAGTFPTHTAQFAGLVMGVIIIITGLEYFPALALGPLVEHLSLGA